MIEQSAQSLGHFLQSHPHWGGVMTFIVSFLESLPIIGTIIPGSVTMTAVGMLIGTGTFQFVRTLLWATTGAFFGDLLSYWVGIYYNERLRSMWPFKKHPEWIERGESFFHKHGGKSIIIGRFIGPLRSIIPLIAGLLHMPLRKFIFAAIPAAFLWALAYMLPGILLGTLSTQLPPNVATKFILILLLIIVLLSLFTWLITIFSTKVREITGHILRTMWEYLRSNKHYDWLTNRIANLDKPEDYRQLGWLVLAIITFACFIIIGFNVFEHSIMTNLNRPVFEFLRSIRNSKTDKIMIGMTLLGNSTVVILSTFFILLWLYWYKKFRDVKHWIFAIAAGLIIPNIFKYFLYFPRPTGLLHASSTSSFPSGHAFLSFMFYGFFATFISSHIKRRYRRYVYYIVSCIILLVSFSRLYLGVHWISDVIASWSLAYSILALVTLSYRRKSLPINIIRFSIFAICSILIIWSSYFAFTYQKNISHYSLDWPSQVIDENTWWGRLNAALPVYRENRFGKPAEPMNIQFTGDIQQLKKILATEGWIANPNVTLLKNTIQKLAIQPNVTSLFPSLYLNRPPTLFMIRDSNENTKLILKLWKSNVYLSESWDVLYIGNIVEYNIDREEKKITYSYNVVEKLMPYLYPNEWRTNVVSTTDFPPKLFQQNWNGDVLQISAPALY